FCDGMTEQLITNLSRIPDLLVIARTSVMQYKKSQKDIRQISNELNVVYILEGSVRKSGNQVRVTAQLIKADEGFHLWADDYDQELTDIFAIQDDVSQSIAKALEVTFSERVSKAVATGYPRNVEAYDYHLKARHYIENIYLMTKEEKDFQQALALAQKAIELDPEYALGYSGLGYLFENHWIVTGDRRYLEKENEYAAKAYKLNPELPETNAALGLRFLREGKNDKAFSYMRSALKLSPNNGAALHLFGVFNWFLGLYQQAAEYYSKALELDPLSIHTLTNRGWTLLLIGEFDCALQVFEKAYKIQPNHVNNLNGYAFALIIKQQYRQADELLTLAESQPPGMASAELSAIRGFYYAVIGKSKQALFVNSWGGVLAILGRKDDALNFIDNASKTEGKFYYLLSYLPLVNLPIYDSLRVEPRFQEIVKREKEKYETRLRQYAIPLNEEIASRK
ncbi:MAG: tetratricopeptide repeat protein, partial [bacterium]